MKAAFSKIKLSISILIFCFVAGFLFGCHKQPIDKNLDSVSYGFESTLEDWKAQGGSGERKFENDIVISSEVAYTGNASCKFTVSPESYVGKGNRAELTLDQKAIEGDESWYEWSFYIPGSYQDVTLEDSTGAPNWQVMGQWHQQPDFEKGETWDNYPHKGKSVPIAVNYMYFSKDDPEFLAIKIDSRTQNLFGYDSTWNNVSVVALSVGDPPIAVCLSKIEKNKWYRIKLHIRWSQNEDGFVEAWLNDKEFTNGKHYGKNMLNHVSHYFKFGLYRNPDIPYTNSVYYDDIRIY